MLESILSEIIDIDLSILQFKEKAFLLIRIEQLFCILHSYFLKSAYSLVMVQVDQDASQIKYYVSDSFHILCVILTNLHKSVRTTK